MSVNSSDSTHGTVEVNLGRHQAQCSICQRSDREAIETRFINWTAVWRITEQYGISRDALYRHCRALGLFAKRRANRMVVLESLIERGDGAFNTTMGGVLSALKYYNGLIQEQQNSEQQRKEDVKKALGQMSQEERDAFARDGSLPSWVTEGATREDSQTPQKPAQPTENTAVQ